MYFTDLQRSETKTPERAMVSRHRKEFYLVPAHDMLIERRAHSRIFRFSIPTEFWSVCARLIKVLTGFTMI